VFPTSGTGAASVSVQPNINGLQAGHYTATITISAAGAAGSPANLTATLDITSLPILNVTPTALTFAGTAGGANPAAQSFAISNPGGGSFTWTASSNQPWLTCSPASGAATGPVSIQPNIAGLAAGSYSATITITAPGATGSPATIGVTLNLTSTPILNVSPTALTFHSSRRNDQPGGTSSRDRQYRYRHTHLERRGRPGVGRDFADIGNGGRHCFRAAECHRAGRGQLFRNDYGDRTGRDTLTRGRDGQPGNYRASDLESVADISFVHGAIGLRESQFAGRDRQQFWGQHVDLDGSYQSAMAGRHAGIRIADVIVIDSGQHRRSGGGELHRGGHGYCAGSSIVTGERTGDAHDFRGSEPQSVARVSHVYRRRRIQ